MEILDPRLDGHTADRRQGHVPETGQNVQVEVAAVAFRGGGPDVMDLAPHLRPLPKSDPTIAGVDVGVAALVGFDVGGAGLGGGLGGVAAVGADGTVG